MDVGVVVIWIVAMMTGLVTVLTVMLLCSAGGSYQGKTSKKRHYKNVTARSVCSSSSPPKSLLPQNSSGFIVHSVVLPRRLHSPCSGCGEVNAKSKCRYSSCGTCCRARESSICPAHDTSYQTCVHAAEIAASLAYTEFDISYSYLKHCPPQVVSIGHQMVSLNLSNNRLQSLPEDLGKLSNLIELFVQYNQLSALPVCVYHIILVCISTVMVSPQESICLMSQLEELDAKNNLLTHLPECIGDNKSLLILNLTNNRLSSLPSSIEGLTKLEELSVHANCLLNLPEELCSLVELKALYAAKNPLTTLPVKFGSLVNLEELDLTDCCLNNLPQSLSCCQQLVKMWLTGNSLRSLPHHLGKLHCLRELHLRNNRIIYLPSSIEHLNLTTFTAQGNCLLTEQEARNLTHTLSSEIPPLLELSLRVIVECKITVKEGVVPQHLSALLSHLVLCSVCHTPTFTQRSTRVVFKTIGVFYRLPLMFICCSQCHFTNAVISN